MPSTVTMERALNGRLVVITIDNPPVNALSRQVRADLLACLEELRWDIARGISRVKVVIIQGSEKYFSGGADLRGELLPTLQAACAVPPIEGLVALEGGEKGARDYITDFLIEGHSFIDAVAAFPIYTVACISGYAFGAGLELALACDERLATHAARLGFPEATLDMLPGWGGIVRSEGLVGIEYATTMYRTGVSILAHKAQSVGLVRRCFESLEEQRTFVERLVRAKTSPVSDWHFWRKHARPLRPSERAREIELFDAAVMSQDPEWKILEFLHRKKNPRQSPDSGFLIAENGMVLLGRAPKNIPMSSET